MYRFEPFEPTSDAIRRLVCGELDGALEWLGGEDRSFDVRVHETRKHLKRLRALLRLATSVIDPATLREEMRAARVAAAALAELRGQAALLSCFEDLIERSPNVLAADGLERVRAALRVDSHATSDPRAAVTRARAILTRARGRAIQLPLVDGVTGWAALGPGFRDTYRRARRAYTRASAEPSAEHFHAFRTPEKRHLYQVELLERAWEAPLRVRRQELSHLGELLGDHHDLSLLQQELRSRVELELEWAALQAPVAERLAKFEGSALSLAALTFAEKPGAITRRFGAYFRASLE